MTDLLFALRRSALVTLAAALALALAACATTGSGTDGGADDGPTKTVTGGTVEITADDLDFDAGRIEAPANQAFTIVLTNAEAVPHNLSVYVEEGGEEIAKGEIINEGQTDEIEVPALEPGEYFFVCDLHTAEMRGILVVEG